ncbi:MAG: ABC transporter permease subunit [Ignavibacteriae bacterium]|nr:ABC transporter permease subunit [Ignavibacteriota bacterium]MCB9206001.1 ABC transporter permease subunit [Ignavibacteriales bacterium]MCB9209278.1 ABC transporter permease subunit [Ignavibacteriales bacterium]MCB9257920.1 ABC transporter permease subunit [Ignavibacteriales bacterium]
MKPIWIIAKREFRTFFDSLAAYILLVVFLGLSGFFTWLFGSDIFFIGQATLMPFFSVAYWTLFFFIPALTMKMLAEEKRSGTLELLLTKPITDWQIVVGKFLSVLMLIGVALLLTIPYYISVSMLGPIDHGSVWSGYIGMLLMSAAFTSIGLFASSITNNQIVAFLLALFVGVFFLIIFDVLASSFTGTIAYFFNYLSLSTHYESISRGVMDSKDLIYFFSITAIGLLLADTVLSKRNIVE